MKGILAEPGKAPVIASLPDSLWAIENRLGTPCEMIVLPRTPEADALIDDDADDLPF